MRQDRFAYDPANRAYEAWYLAAHRIVVPDTVFDAARQERAHDLFSLDYADLSPAQRGEVDADALVDIGKWARSARYHASPCPGCQGARPLGGVPEDRPSP